MTAKSKARPLVKSGTSKADERKAKFIEAMVATGGNKRASAIAAGYKPGRAADKAGERLSHNVAVMSHIEKRESVVMAKVAENTEVTKQWIIGSLKAVAVRCMRKSAEFNPSGANRALELLGKEQGMFIERTMAVKDPLEGFAPHELREFYAVLKARQEARKAPQPASAMH
jgi:hypothetical protein